MQRMIKISSGLITIIVLFLLTSFTAMSVSFAKDSNAPVEYELAISFDIDSKQLHGTAHITLAPEEELTLFLNDIETTGVIINNSQSPPAILKLIETSQITIPSYKDQQEVFISYRKTVVDEIDNFIENNGITLISNWHPQPSRDVIFSLKTQVPQGFVAISETDIITPAVDNTYSFTFSHPTSSINFVAAPFVINTLMVRPNLKVYTFLHETDKELATNYLKAASDYLRLYEKSIGPYPYNHFAIVENLRPTGYGMPTFTLLGNRVIRLPFIISTSLGHEILHSWFGNAIRVDETSGNWSEGFTSYLADWAYRENKGEGAINRKENIIKYLSYVSDENNIPLQLFNSASHYQTMAKAVRSVGYSKGAMLFHELKKRIGLKSFDSGISLFYKRYTDKKASWQDIKNIFEEVSQLPLDNFFTDKLTRKDIPELVVDNININQTSDGFSLFFTLSQKTALPYNLLVPIRVETSNGPVWFQQELTSEKKEINLSLDSSPFSLSIDPDYDLLRKLSEEERVPTLSYFFGPSQKTVVIASHEKERFAPLLDFFVELDSEVMDITEIKNSDLEKDNLIFLGIDNQISRALFGLPSHPPNGLTLDVRHHPLNNEKNILLVSCDDRLELKKALRRLPHYGKYSYLHFDNGRVKTKSTLTGNMGQHYSLEQPPVAVASSSLVQFSDLIKIFTDSRAIYIGEAHTSMPDHHLQFRIIEELYKQNPEIAIGMEMFPKSSQKALDDYIENDEKIDEKKFLKQSRYFQVWKYDYRYYRNIINFAKKNGIPLLGLNIDKNIVSSIFNSGSTDSLTDEERILLPIDRNLDMVGYRQRLSAIHDMHMQGNHGEGSLGGFIQAQGIWDEIMAETVADYLNSNPKKQMIVLAGAQHTRKDSGIPPRVLRRLDIKQQSILSSNHDTKPSQAFADYYLSTMDHDIAPAGKIGVTLEETKKDDKTFLLISKLSPHSKAKESGIQENDTLLSINGYSVKDIEDVRIAMVDAKPGEIASLKLERTNNVKEIQQLTIAVELYNPEQIMR